MFHHRSLIGNVKRKNDKSKNGYPKHFIISQACQRQVHKTSQFEEPRATATIQNRLALRDLLVNVKDSVPLQDRASVVYRIPCEYCEGAHNNTSH